MQPAAADCPLPLAPGGAGGLWGTGTPLGGGNPEDGPLAPGCGRERRPLFERRLHGLFAVLSNIALFSLLWILLVNERSSERRYAEHAVKADATVLDFLDQPAPIERKSSPPRPPPPQQSPAASTFLHVTAAERSLKQSR